MGWRLRAKWRPKSPQAAPSAGLAWTVASATHIGGGLAADADGDVHLGMPTETPKAVFAAGLGGLFGALVWDAGQVGSYVGPLGFGIKPVAWTDETFIAVGLAVAASAPTTMAELGAAEHQFGQLVRRFGNGEQKITTHIRTNDQGLLDGTQESRTDSQSLSWSCSVGLDRFGGSKWVHHWPAGGQAQPQTGVISAALNPAHRLFPFLAWGARNTHPAPRTLLLTLSGRAV